VNRADLELVRDILGRQKPMRIRDFLTELLLGTTCTLMGIQGFLRRPQWIDYVSLVVATLIFVAVVVRYRKGRAAAKRLMEAKAIVARYMGGQ
jgi:hypothetical protein